MEIKPGLVNEIKRIVTKNDTASSSGDTKLPDVLSTPKIVSWLEGAAHLSVVDLVGPGQTTVGTMVNIRHLAATPVGMAVTLRAELLEADGRRLRFKVEAWDQVEKIADGEHERFIIDCDRFTKRVEQKRAML